MGCYALRGDQWDKKKVRLPEKLENISSFTAKDNHLFVEAVLYSYRAGIS
ncbi:hypothetical protein HE1_00941 [Holospora elegans E1]|uniref:Uncharacterized protein n=1 Tax=Holospora elegans E1 TaxID=1427503 RepID=A0A023DYN6_9PROT|nr:hypothetical protein HE1_00941 [Holospora elegans E1]